MTVTIYLIGCFLSCIVWFGMLKIRQKGFYVPMPKKYEGNLLEPLNHKEVDWSLVMLGWLIITVLWPLAWFFIILLFLFAYAITIVTWLWNSTIGNEELARKIFGVKK